MFHHLLARATILTLGAPGLVQASEEDLSWRLETIIVAGSVSGYTANAAGITRTQTPLIDVPQSIQVLTPSLLREQELQTLSDAVRNISGVAPNDPTEAFPQIPNFLLRSGMSSRTVQFEFVGRTI